MCTTLEHVPSVGGIFCEGGGVCQNVPNPELKMFYYTPKRLNYPPNLCENNNVMKVTPLIGSPVSQNNDYIKVTLLILGLESQNNK